MKIAVSSDEYSPLIDDLLAAVKEYGHETVYFGPLKGDKPIDWPDVTLQAIDALKTGDCSEAIVLCWTGTGCTLVANKVPGVRAALCADAETARGARKWNHANVLGLSLRMTSGPLLKEILSAWFDTSFTTDEWNVKQMKKIKDLEDHHCMKAK